MKDKEIGDIAQIPDNIRAIKTHLVEPQRTHVSYFPKNEGDVSLDGGDLEHFSDRAIYSLDRTQNLDKVQIFTKFEQRANDPDCSRVSICSFEESGDPSSNSKTSSSSVSVRNITPFRNIIRTPPESCDCENPRIVIKALEDKERKNLQRFSFFQFFTISNWVNTGNQNFLEVINKENQGIKIIKERHQELPGMQLLGHFLENRNAMILPLQVEGISILSTIDTGAAITISSDTFFALNINPFFQQTLQPYEGPRLHSCQDKHLIVLGVYKAQFQIGTLKVYHPIVIYESSLKELLIGYDMISKYDMIISRKGLYAPQNIPTSGQLRVGQAHVPYFPIYSRSHHIIQPYLGENILVYIDSKNFQMLMSEATSKEILWVAHSQDHEYCPNQENLSIFFQAVTIHDCKATIYFHNNTDFPISIAMDEEIGAVEQMSQISLKDIHHQNDEKILQIYRSLIDIPRYRELHERESELFMDLPEQQLQPLDWQQLDCPPIPGLKDKLIMLCQKYQNIFGLDKWDVKSINMGSSKYVKLSINTGTSPVNQMAIPTHQSLLPAAKKFLQTLLDRNLIGLAPQKCAWSSSLFFVRKRRDANIVTSGDEMSPGAKMEPVPRVTENAHTREATNGPKNSKNKKNGHSSENAPINPKRAQNGQNSQKLAKNVQNDIKMKKQEEKTIEPPDIRAIVDLRGVNQKLKLNSLSAWPILPCREIINQLQSKNYVSQLDCLIAYWQVPLSSKNGQNFLAFNFQGCHFVPKKLQHGMNCSMSIFTRIITKILIKAKLDPYVQAFCDNLIVATETLDQHLEVLEKLFSTLDSANIKIHYAKQNLCHNKSIKLFGYILDLEKKLLSPDGAKLREISQISTPKTKKQCRKYTGMFAMWSTIIPNLSKILSPIYANCSEKAVFKWGPEQEKSWQDSKNLLIQHFSVTLPDHKKQFIIVSDAARKLGCSHTVFQRNNEGNLCPISHFSKVFKGSEIYFSQAKAEMFSLVLGLNMNIMYFCIAGPQRHLALTDAICLQWAAKYCYQNAQLYNWSTFIFSLPIKVLALAQSSPLIVWSDMWSRPQHVKKAIEKVYNDKKFDPKQLITCDFSGLPALNIEDIFKICTKFNKILEKYGEKTVKNCLADNKEDLQFPEKPKHVLQIASNQMLILDQEKTKKSPDFFSIGIYKTFQNPRQKDLRDLCHPGNQQILEAIQIFQTHLSHVSLPGLAKLQDKDILCRKMKGKADLCFFSEGLLFKTCRNRSKLIIPKSLTFPLLWSLHNFNTIYHISYQKLKSFTDKYFVIQGFSGTLQKILSQCEYCLLNTKAPWPRQNILGPTFLVSHPFTALHFDFLVVNSSFKKYPSLLTVTDYFSNASWFYAANHNISGRDFVNMFLSHIAQVCGIPTCVNHDGQAAFISDKLATLCKVLRIKQFVSTRAASNRSEAKNAIALKIARAIFQKTPLDEEFMPALGTLLSLSYNSLPIALHKAAPIDILHNMGFNKPRLHKLNFLGLPNKESKDVYLLRLAQLKEIMLQIKIRMYQRMKNAPNVVSGLKKGDFCLVARKSKGHAPAAKLKARYFKKPFRVYQLKRRSAVVVPFDTIKIVPSEHMRKGRRPERPKKLIVPWERLKKISNPFPLLDLPFSEKEIDNFASFLQKKASKTEIDRVQLINSSPKMDPEAKKIRDFLCLPLNPATKVKSHQKQKAKDQWRNFQKLKNAEKSKNFRKLFENSNIFKVTDGAYLYDFVSSINTSMSFDPSPSERVTAVGKTERRKERFFKSLKPPTAPSSMFQSNCLKDISNSSRKTNGNPQSNFFNWLKNQPNITHLYGENMQAAAKHQVQQGLQGKKVSSESLVSGISTLLDEIHLSDNAQGGQAHMEHHYSTHLENNRENQKMVTDDDGEDNHDSDNREKDDFDNNHDSDNREKDDYDNNHDSDNKESDDDHNDHNSEYNDTDDGDDNQDSNNSDSDDGGGNHDTDGDDGDNGDKIDNDHIQKRTIRSNTAASKLGARPKLPTPIPITSSVENQAISEINVLDSDEDSQVISKKSVSFGNYAERTNRKRTSVQAVTALKKTGRTAAGTVVTQCGLVRHLPDQHRPSHSIKTKPNQTKPPGLEKDNLRPHIVIQNPEHLISDELLKSSGTPRHVPAQLPYKVPSTSTKAKTNKQSKQTYSKQTINKQTNTNERT